MNQYAGTHKRKVRTYSILAKVFLPVGLVLLILGIILLTVGIITFVLGLQSLIDSGACVQHGASYQCNIEGAAGGVSFVLGILGMVFGGLGLGFGLPLFILNFVFRSLARSNRKADEANGVDYSDFPYGQ
ncbi:MAG: hypothetical protein IJS52_07660 [Bacilli bacterium]|nr:hypothetical protein [Bacilli bacterium]